MASPLLSPLLLLLLSCLTLLHKPPFSAANIHKATTLFRSQPISESASLFTDETPPTTYFEVTKPIPLPNTQPCSSLVLQHDFGSTYGKPPVLANYSPPSDCPSRDFAKIVLEWTATCKGRQFDRIFGVWVGGVEIFRSCTAEPKRTGIVWTVKKDITRYSSLLMTNQTLAVYIGNIVDSTYTGVYHVNLTFHFYPAEKSDIPGGIGNGESDYGFGSVSDLILPISRNLPLNDGLWFEIENSTDIESKEFKIPQNVYRAVLEVYVSFHENDEFWYGNFPNEYISANNLTGTPGNGPFREVVVRLDDLVVGAVWPFTVIYTGGINPLFWRPITGIGSFDLPTYDIEITPFLGNLLDGKTHNLSFLVTNASNVWYIDANLHLWLDKKSVETEGKLLNYKTAPLSFSLAYKYSGPDGLFITNASRFIVSSGLVKSSHGVIETKSHQGFKYSNSMVLRNDGNFQIVNQTINLKGGVDSKKPSSSVQSTKSQNKFHFHMDSDVVDKGNGTMYKANLSFGIKEKMQKKYGEKEYSTSRINNLQKAEGYMFVEDGSISDGLGSTQQKYCYNGENDKSCYFRGISSKNYTILHDEQTNSCEDHHGCG